MKTPRRPGQLLWTAMLAALLATGVTARAVMAPQPITLVSLDFEPKSIDVSYGPQPVLVTAHIIAQAPGFSYGSITFSSPYGNQQTGWFDSGYRTAGDEYDGTYEIWIPFQQPTDSGTWRITDVTLIDMDGYGTSFSESDLINLGFPTELWVICNYAPPELVEFDFTPKSIDVTAAPQDVTLTLHVVSLWQGLSWGEVYFISPSGGQWQSANFGPWNLISGYEGDGIYQVTLTFPQFIESGTWSVYGVWLQDYAGWTTYLYGFDLAARGYPTELEVLSNLDATPPELVAFDFAPKTIDVTTGPQDVTVTAHVTDDLSGITEGWVVFTSPSGGWYWYSWGPWNCIQGNELDGVYQFPITFQQFSEPGVWRINLVYLQDAMGNYCYYYEPDLVGLGFPVELRVSPPLKPVAYPLVSYKRISRTVWEYVYKFTIKNEGVDAVSTVSAELDSWPAQVAIVDGQVTFGTVAGGQQVTSQDTFTLRIDRSVPVQKGDLTWKLSYTDQYGTSFVYLNLPLF